MFTARKDSKKHFSFPAVLGLLAVLAAVLILYRGAFFGYFVQDDYGWLESSRYVSPGDFLKCFFRFNPALTYRPLSQETFFSAGQALFGLNPIGFHAVSMGFHLGGCVLLYLLLRSFFSVTPSLAGALFYGIHPAHVRSVYWVSALPEPMALFFFLAAVVMFIRFDRSGNRKAYLSSLAAMGIGVLSKESILTVPLVLTAYTALFSRRRILWTLPFFCVSGLYTILRLISESVRAAPYPLTFGHGAWSNLLAYFSWSSGLTETILKVKLGLQPEEIYGRAALLFVIAAAVLVAAARCRKETIFGLLWFAFGLQPVLYFWKHIDPYYLAPSLAGLSILIAATFPGSLSLESRAAWIPAVLALAFISWTAQAGVRLEGRWWNDRAEVGRHILSNLAEVDHQVPAGKIVFLFGLGASEFGVLQNDAALKAFGFPSTRFILFGLDPDTARQIRNLKEHGGIMGYHCFLYSRGAFIDMTGAFRRRPERLIEPVGLKVSPAEVRAGTDTLTLKVIHMDARAIDVQYRLNGEEMAPINYWPLDARFSATLPVDGNTRKGSYQFTAIRDAEEREGWYPVDVRVTVR